MIQGWVNWGDGWVEGFGGLVDNDVDYNMGNDCTVGWLGGSLFLLLKLSCIVMISICFSVSSMFFVTITAFSLSFSFLI